MQETFSHPLARDAKVWRSHGDGGSGRDILVIVTTLVLEQDDKSHKADKVARLSDAARTWLARTSQADDFVLISRPKDW